VKVNEEEEPGGFHRLSQLICGFATLIIAKER